MLEQAIRELRRERDAVGQAILSRADGKALRRAIGDLNLEIERLLRLTNGDGPPPAAEAPGG